MSDTITFRGQTYQMGDAGTPLHLAHIAPTTLGTEWTEVDGSHWSPERDYGRAYKSRMGLLVLLSASLKEHKRWLHVSVSHRGGRLPTWGEMCAVKTLFCGDKSTAYQVHPPASKNVSIHEKCLHLWCPLDGSITPDFTGGGQTI